MVRCPEHMILLYMYTCFVSVFSYNLSNYIMKNYLKK